jgi:hypothetical protein
LKGLRVKRHKELRRGRNMKKRIMMVLVGFALLFAGKIEAGETDAVFENWDFNFGLVPPFDTYYNTDYYTKLDWALYPSGTTGFSTTDVSVVYANPGVPFVKCLPNGFDFVANSVFLAFNNPDTNWCDVEALTGATNGIGEFSWLATNGVAFLPNGSFILGGSFSYPGGYSASVNLCQVNADGAIQDLTFQALDGVVTNLTYESNGFILVQGTFTEVKDATHGLVTSGFDAGTGVYWEPASHEWQIGG